MSFQGVYPEQHDSLPETPEPAENPVLFGHEDAAAALAADYRSGRLHHAIVLAGSSGIGKATLAFHLARHILANPDPAGAPADLAPADTQGQTWRLVAQAAHPSLLHLTRPAVERGKGFRTAITVDEVRRVNRFLSRTAHDGGHRVVIVDPADDMNVNAANALLKSLEEPPRNCLFLLTCHSPGRLLATIRSRCRLVRLRSLADDELLKALAAAGCEPPASDATRRLLLDQAGGSVRDALMLVRFSGLDIVAALDSMLEASLFDVASAYRLADTIASRDDGARWSVFNDAVLARISELGRQAAEAGRLDQAAVLARLWLEAGEQVEVTRIYNLDRKQHVVGLLRRLHDAARPARLAGV